MHRQFVSSIVTIVTTFLVVHSQTFDNIATNRQLAQRCATQLIAGHLHIQQRVAILRIGTNAIGYICCGIVEHTTDANIQLIGIILNIISHDVISQRHGHATILEDSLQLKRIVSIVGISA